MNAEQIQAAALIIKDSALQFLADKNGLTVNEVVFAIKEGNINAAKQFNDLVTAGVNQAMAMFA
jgi:hypothetical protein